MGEGGKQKKWMKRRKEENRKGGIRD